MKNLLIIGARGFGREIYYLATQCKGYGKEFKVKGFLDDKIDALEGYDMYPPIVSSVEGYVVEKDDVFICAVGEVKYRKKYIDMILDKKGVFISLIHPSANVDMSAKIGNGSIVLAFATLGAGSVVGEYAIVMETAIISHDASVGQYSRVDSNAVLVGRSSIGDRVTVHTAAVVNCDVVVEDGATVGACSFVIRKVKEDTTVFGNPARRINNV